MAHTLMWPTAEAVGRATVWPWQLVCNHGDEAVTTETTGMVCNKTQGWTSRMTPEVSGP